MKIQLIEVVTKGMTVAEYTVLQEMNQFIADFDAKKKEHKIGVSSIMPHVTGKTLEEIYTKALVIYREIEYYLDKNQKRYNDYQSKLNKQDEQGYIVTHTDYTQRVVCQQDYTYKVAIQINQCLPTCNESLLNGHDVYIPIHNIARVHHILNVGINDTTNQQSKYKGYFIRLIDSE